MGTKCCTWGEAALKLGEKSLSAFFPLGEFAGASKLLYGLG